MQSRQKTLLMVVNDAGFFLSHRAPVAMAARENGFKVVVATAAGPMVSAVLDAGYDHCDFRLTRSGRNPVAEAISIVSLIRLFRSVRPDIAHLVTIKPVLYGGIAARMTGVPGVVSAVSGLGTIFGPADGPGMRIARFAANFLYRLALKHRNQRVVFQNSSDRDVLLDMTGIDPDKAVLISGSGVDLSEYTMTDETETDAPVVVMAGRLLRDKGINEFVEAAGILKSRGVRARFLLVGDPDPGNPSSITETQLEAWRGEDNVEILGYRPDVATIFSTSHVVVLPSYREGLPKVLIEAAACGRAVVTTDVPGCRDAIEPGQSGLLVPPRDAPALANAIECVVRQPDTRRQMGRAGRKLAERQFGIDQVVEAHLSTYDALLADVQSERGTA